MRDEDGSTYCGNTRHGCASQVFVVVAVIVGIAMAEARADGVEDEGYEE